MAPKPAVRRAITNENDENAVSTRVTRAKAAAGDSSSDLVKKPLARSKSTLSNQASQVRKRALNDLSNQQKEPLASKDLNKKVVTKTTTLKTAAHPTKVEKSSRPAGSKPSLLQEKKNSAKRAAPAPGPGHVTKSRKLEVSKTKVHIATENENQDPAVVSISSSTTQVEEKLVVDDFVDHDLGMDDDRDATEEVWPAMPEGVKDLDREDLDDPLMVAEYVGEIFEYLAELEQRTMPNPKYMENQPELEWDMRGILVDWLLEVHTRFRLLPETLFLTVNILDRFCSNKIVQLDRLQLVGVAAMFIASKYEEVLSPHVSNFRHVSDDGFTEDEILHAEKCVLTALDYDLSYPNPMNFLRRISKADDYDVQTRTLGKYLLEISCLDHHFLEHPPSRVAAASMYTARLILGKGPWDATIAHYAGCTEEELLPCFHLMLNYLTGPVKHDAFFKKYAHKKFMKASMVVRNWVKEHGPKYLDDEHSSTEHSSRQPTQSRKAVR